MISQITTDGKDKALAYRAATYTHDQSGSSATWTITHNLRKFPSVTTVDNVGNIILGDVSYTNKNQVVVSFTTAISGMAYLN